MHCLHIFRTHRNSGTPRSPRQTRQIVHSTGGQTFPPCRFRWWRNLALCADWECAAVVAAAVWWSRCASWLSWRTWRRRPHCYIWTNCDTHKELRQTLITNCQRQPTLSRGFLRCFRHSRAVSLHAILVRIPERQNQHYNHNIKTLKHLRMNSVGILITSHHPTYTHCADIINRLTMALSGTKLWKQHIASKSPERIQLIISHSGCVLQCMAFAIHPNKTHLHPLYWCSLCVTINYFYLFFSLSR